MLCSTPACTKLKQRDIRQLFLKAKRVVREPGLDILLAPSAGCGQLVVVTPRYTGNAPERNKIKRRLRAIFHQEQLFQYGYHCIVLVKRDGIHTEFAKLKELLIHAFALSSPSKSTP